MAETNNQEETKKDDPQWTEQKKNLAAISVNASYLIGLLVGLIIILILLVLSPP